MNRTRHFGRTGLRVTRLGLGLAALGRPGYMNVGRTEDLPLDRSVAVLESRALAVLDAAYDAGVRMFDAARSYGRAEAFLRAWLDRRGFDPGDVVVSSKWGYTYTADWQVDAEVHEVKEHSLQRLLHQWELTRQHLWEYLDVYQIHSATLDSGVLENLPVLEGLAQLKAVHGVRMGLTVTGPEQANTVKRALEIELDGERLFDTVQATWNPLEPSVGAALLTAREEGMGVVIKEALANGRLTERGLSGLPPAVAVGLRAAEERHRVSVSTWALAAALAQPWADVVLSGAVTEAQVRSNIEAAELEWTDADAEALEALIALAPPAPTYWADRKRLPWR